MGKYNLFKIKEEEKNEIKEKWDKQQTKSRQATYLNPNISIIPLNINGLNPPKTKIVKLNKKARPNYMASIRNVL